MDEPKKPAQNLEETANDLTPEDVQLANIEAIDTSEDSRAGEPPRSTAEIVQPTYSSSSSNVSHTSDIAKLTGSFNKKPDTIPIKAKRFLMAYVATVFSALGLLCSVSILGYVLAQHFFGPKQDDANISWFYIDFAPFYIAMMASILTFGVLYMIASRYVAHSSANDTIGLKDWRAYKIIYAIFSAGLLAYGASVIGSLIYIPLAQVLIAGDLQSKEITVAVIGGIHTLVWIGLLIWQERLVKHGKASIPQGLLVGVAASVIIVLTAIFPVGSKTNERYDNRASTDLDTITAKIDDYKSEHKDALPTDLKALDFGETPLAGRLAKYTYTVKETTKAQEVSVSTQKYLDSLKELESESATTSNESDDVESDAAYDSSALEDSAADIDAFYKSLTTKSTQPAKVIKTYEICATFKTDTSAKKYGTNALDAFRDMSTTGNMDPFTKHKSGVVCFYRE